MRWAQKWYVVKAGGYAVGTVKPGTKESPFQAGEKFYTVSKSAEGSWGCSCPHWINRRGICKHIEMVKNSGKVGARVDGIIPVPFDTTPEVAAEKTQPTETLLGVMGKGAMWR